jgi:hypothetical protein
MQGLAAWSEGKPAPAAPSPSKVPVSYERGTEGTTLQGYLAYKKQPRPADPPSSKVPRGLG